MAGDACRALESELSAIDRSNAHEQLHQRLAVLSTEPDSSRADAAREVFRTALRQLFREAEARLKDKLRTVLADQWAELLMRLYKRKVHDASRAVSRSKCVFIPAFAQFVRTLLNAVGGDADGGGFVDRGKLDASVADLGRVIGEARAELARLREPKEVRRSCGTLLRVLQRIARCQQAASTAYCNWDGCLLQG